jgi:Right handed beta helix region
MSASRARSHHIYVHEHGSKIPDLHVRYGSREHSKDQSSVQRQSIHLYDGRHGANQERGTRQPRDSVSSVSDIDGNENARINRTRLVQIEVRRPGAGVSVQGSFIDKSSLGESLIRPDEHHGNLSNKLEFIRSRTMDNHRGLQSNISHHRDNNNSNNYVRMSSQGPIRPVSGMREIEFHAQPGIATRTENKYSSNGQMAGSGYGYVPLARQEYEFNQPDNMRYSTTLRDNNLVNLHGSMLGRSGVNPDIGASAVRSGMDISSRIDEMRLYDVLEIPEGEHIVENLKLLKTICLHGTGRAEHTKLIIKGEVHIVLNPSFDGFGPATRKTQEFFREKKLIGAGCEINLTKNRVVFSNLSLSFETSHMGVNPLIRVSPVSTLSAIGCIFSGVNYQTVFADDSLVMKPPKQRDTLRWITLESCIFLGFKTLFDEKETSHNLFASRSQLKNFIGPILVSSPGCKIVMDNSSIAQCIDNPILISLPELPMQSNQNLTVHTMSGLNGYTSGNYPTPYQQNLMSSQQVVGLAGTVARHNASGRGAALPTAKNPFLALRMMDFKDNRSVCIKRVGHNEAGFADRVDCISLESCLFEKNSSGCIDILNSKGLLTDLIGCVFNHNEGKVIQIRNSGLTKIVNCGFNDNIKDFFVYIEKSSLYFERTVCYRNTRGICIFGDPNLGRYRLSSPCKIEILNSRIDGVDFDGIDIKPCPNMKIKIHNNYIMACQNAVFIDSTGMSELLQTNMGKDQLASLNQHHLRPNIDFYNNDFTQCREWGLRLQGPLLMIPLRHDKILDNRYGAIIAADSPDLELPHDPTYPPEIRGIVELNGQRQTQGSFCELI